MLIASGMDIVTVASLAGDSVDVITKVYAHALKEREAAAMDKIGAVFEQISAATPKLMGVAALGDPYGDVRAYLYAQARSPLPPS